jgi:hypothetical protein
MTKKQFGVVFTLFTIVLVLSMIGGTWVTALAQGTITNNRLGIPVTGCSAGLPDMQSCTGPYVGGLGGVCVPFGITEDVKAIGDPTLPGMDQITPVTNVLKVSVNVNGVDTTDYTFGEAVEVYFTNQNAIQKFTADPSNLSIMWYDPILTKWVKVETILLDGKLVDKNIHSGLYVVGS